MKKILAILLAAVAASPLRAGDDFGIWAGAEASKDFGKKFSVEGGFEFRAEQNLQQVARWDFSAGGSYKPVKYLKLSAAYVYIYDHSPQEAKENYTQAGKLNGWNVDHGFWRSKHRFAFDVTGKLPVGRFTFSLRERYQFTHYMATTVQRDRYRDEAAGGYSGPTYPYEGKNYTEKKLGTDKKSAKNRHYLRSRLQVEYNIRHCPFTPYAAFEVSNDMGSQLHLDKKRVTVGGEWKVTKQHRLDFSYLYEDGADDDANGNLHAICVGYKFKF